MFNVIQVFLFLPHTAVYSHCIRFQLCKWFKLTLHLEFTNHWISIFLKILLLNFFKAKPKTKFYLKKRKKGKKET